MRRLLLPFFCLLTSLSFSSDLSWIRYSDVHAMGGYPMVGMGLRFHQDNHGLDLSFHALPLNGFSPLIFHARGQYLVYPLDSGLYAGMGLGLLTSPENIKGPSPSVEGSLGYQWEFGRGATLFAELQATAPLEESRPKAYPVWPGLTLGIGF